MYKLKSLLFSLILLCSLSGYCQKIIIDQQTTNRNLIWTDFSGKPDKGSPHCANTWYNLKYQTGNIQINGDSVSIGNFEVTLELDPKKSWVKEDKATDELLVHEQGHFKLGILCMREILAIKAITSFKRSNYNATIQRIFMDTSKKYQEMGVKYDEETNHSKNTVEQEKWNAFFREKLAQ